ncbi:hypothetical protein MVEN_00795800 [Mycena venus]|uniref:Uncharacterized protein n=1 Tax=Mycena venus TaxID=2733690 RepID=A0A8H7D6G8_9AGAR|nr:hypothetical protein MVEN_00795800 [Mycena venus]
MHLCVQVAMDVAFFRSFFSGHTSITPADFSKDSPVVLTELNNSQAGEVFRGKVSMWLTI